MSRLAHAYLFVGKEGIGKRKSAKFLSQLITCENQENDLPCMACADCIQIENGTHPDVLEAGCEGSLKVDDMRELIRRISMKNYSALYKIVIIDKVDSMSASVADAFLKTLEEPPQNVLFFLITSKPYAVSQTIRSRTQKIWFALKHDDLRLIIEEKSSEENSKVLVAMSDGSPGNAEKIINDDFLSLRNNVIETLPLSFNVDYRDRSDLKRDSHTVLQFLRDCLMVKEGSGELVVNKDIFDKISLYANRFSNDDLIVAIKNLMNIIATLDNINLGLAKELINNIL